jgi:hypothetical protein
VLVKSYEDPAHKTIEKTSSKPILLLVLLLVTVQLITNPQFALPQAEMPKASSLIISTSSSDTSRIALHQSSLQILEQGDGVDTIYVRYSRPTASSSPSI